MSANIAAIVPARRTRAALGLGWALRRLRELADPVAVWRARPDKPVPPRRLRGRVGAPGVREFTTSGEMAARELDTALGACGRAFADCHSVLDLGCGSARVLPHVAALAPHASCTGCDVDEQAIAWAARHYPGMTWSVSRSEPPLPYADGSFELVYSISVLSHLGEAGQMRWLREVSRVLGPGGLALLSIHGRSAFEKFRTGAVRSGWCEPEAFDRSSLEPEEFAFVSYTRSVFNAGELPGVSADYGLAFHGEGYVREQWSRFLSVDAIFERAVADWQDVVVCRQA
jgi:SAM-dependent methyltransferase